MFRTIRSYGLGTYNENTASAPETRKNHYDIVYRYSLQDELLLTNAVREVVQTLNNGSAYEKVKAVHDYICNNVTYCYEKTENGNDMYINAYDAMFHHQTVCEGYAYLFQKFMEEMNIPCYVVSGIYKQSSSGMGHAWNVVNIDGKWYHVDCTWDDPDSGIRYKYFLVGASEVGYSSVGNVQLENSKYIP